ncbi:MAG: VIT1/CCC1 family protein [Candidatus Thermoplasmatota archaeon]|nr:VIT1/CCC1 family protein [Candidatus Thermoplasmatota archaeon]
MPLSDRLKEMQNFYRDELTDREFYGRLSTKIKGEWLKTNLIRLSGIENEHSEFWKKYLEKENVKITAGPRMMKVRFLLFVHFILGTGLTVKLLEYGEVDSVERYRKHASRNDGDQEFREGLEKIISDEIQHEDVFSFTLEENRKQIERNRDIIYGISDGLVEVLAAMAGLVAIISNHFDVALGGIVVGVSGAMSMGVGAYLARNSEAQYKISTLRRKAILGNRDHDHETIEKYKGESIKSALNTGGFYIIGAIIPILPFIFVEEYLALIISVALVAVTQAISNSVIAISMNMKIAREAAKSAVLALLAAFASYLVGQVFHILFHISLI